MLTFRAISWRQPIVHNTLMYRMLNYCKHWLLAFYANAARLISFSGNSHFCLVELFLVWFRAVMLRRFLMIAWIVVFSSCAQGFSESSGQQNQMMGLIMMTALFPKIPRFAYSTNFNSNNIWMYAVDYSSGMLGSLGTRQSAFIQTANTSTSGTPLQIQFPSFRLIKLPVS